MLSPHRMGKRARKLAQAHATNPVVSHEAWVEHVFGSSYRHGAPAVVLQASPPRGAEMAAYLERLFVESGGLVARFGIKKVSRGLWFLGGSGGAAFREVSRASAAAQDRCVAAIETLYRDVFEPRCDDTLSHGRVEESNPLNTICFMWWDLDGGIDLMPRGVVIQVLRSLLELESVACIEGALHGLGHWHWRSAKPVEAAIDGFLQQRGGTLRPELEAYARAARTGSVQ